MGVFHAAPRRRSWLALAILTVLSGATAGQITVCSSSATLPLAVPDDDAAGATDTFNLCDTGAILDLNVDLLISHAVVGDLIVELTHVTTGTTVVIMDRPGFIGAGFGCGNPDVDATFDDASLIPVEGECSVVPPAIGGVVAPENPLAAFNGQDIGGLWRITVSDHAAGATGTLDAWCLSYTVGLPGTPSWRVCAPVCVGTGGSVDVAIETHSVTASQGSAQWHLYWDPTIFTLDPGFGTGGILFAPGWTGIANTMLPGDLYVVSWHLVPYPVGADTQATVRLLHIGSFGTTPITGEVEIWGDDMLAPIIPGPFDMAPTDVTIGCMPLPTCNITDPTPGQLLIGSHLVTFDVANPAANPVDLTYEFFESGVGWIPASRVGGGPSMDLGVAAGTGLSFDWDLVADFFLSQSGVDFRVTVVDPIAAVGNSCVVNVDIDVINTAPTCTFTDPLSGQVVVAPTHTVVFDLMDAQGDAADLLYEFDIGGGFLPATRVGGGPSTDSGIPPAVGLTFDWDVSADIVGSALGVVLRISTDDLRPGGMGSCSVTVDVRPPNNPPVCNIFFPGGGTSVMVLQDILFATSDGDGDLLDLVMEFDAGMGFVPATATMASALPNPAIDVPPSGANSFEWDIVADVFVTTPGVVFRISVDDGFGGTTSCMRTWDVDAAIDPPSCIITSPVGGALIAGAGTIVFDAMDPTMDPLDITYEFNAGVGFMPATRVGPGGSMDSGVAPATGLTFDWNAGVDVPGGALSVTFRVSVDDRRGGSAFCSVNVDVVGGGTCPTPAGCGDCSGDGILSILDSLTAAQGAAGVIVLTPGTLQFNKCNVTGAVSPSPGAVVDILDSLTLAQAAAGLPVTLGCC